jgi:hypothetical protein
MVELFLSVVEVQRESHSTRPTRDECVVQPLGRANIAIENGLDPEPAKHAERRLPRPGLQTRSTRYRAWKRQRS